MKDSRTGDRSSETASTNKLFFSIMLLFNSIPTLIDSSEIWTLPKNRRKSNGSSIDEFLRSVADRIQ